MLVVCSWALVLDSMEWRSMAYMPEAVPPARRSHVAVVLHDPKTGGQLMVVYGGWTDSGECPSRERVQRVPFSYAVVCLVD